MRDYAFYNAGCVGAKGVRRVLVLGRRLLRRVLRPIFFRLADLFRQQDQELAAQERRLDELSRFLWSINQRQEQLDRQHKAVLALGWDQVATARRLAILEDHVEALLRAEEERREPETTLRAAN